ncbi:hypothetical protein Taro_041726 [Colocasia esculenta]|uniref:Uncharacterized protein n=1 Tax=Colocasia esculenta TaxID=4460 RepID=A0A843WWP0_COLES|nr:hypothetical protein [Colocasia esculenta]
MPGGNRYARARAGGGRAEPARGRRPFAEVPAEADHPGAPRGEPGQPGYRGLHHHPLTTASPSPPPGVRQACEAGCRIRDVLASSCSPNWKVYFYVSPYERTLSTLRELGRAFPRRRILGVREQDFSNFQVERMHVIKETCELFGRFFFRFP